MIEINTDLYKNFKMQRQLMIVDRQHTRVSVVNFVY